MLDAQRAIHLFLVAVLFCFSVVLQMPGNQFDNYAFSKFKDIAVEQNWAFTMLFAAMIGFAGFLTTRRGWRRLSLITLASMHGIVGVCFLQARLPLGTLILTGTPTYLLISTLGYYLCFLLWFE